MSPWEHFPEKVETNNVIEKSDVIQREYLVEKEDIEKTQDQTNIQKSMHDLGQDQHVEANPTQFNFQNVQLTVDNDMDKFACKITGVTYSKNNREVLPNAVILLYFGSYDDSGAYAVCQTKSDDNGNFIIEDLPPGYYTLYAYLGRYLTGKIHNIKIMPGQKHNQSVFLGKLEEYLD